MRILYSLSSSVVKRFAFKNDAAGNLVGQQVDDISLGEVTALGGAMNRANQLLNLKDEGPVHVSGTLDEPGLVTIDDVVIATDVATDGFEAWAEVDAFGKFNIRALDYSDNETSKTVSVALESPGDNSFTYDRNGNMLSGLDGAVYTWDVNDRLRKAETGTYSVSLDYNAAGLPYHLVQMNGMTEVAERWFIWDGFSLVEERYSLNGGPDKVRRIYAEGEEDDGNDLYYSYDHLGSVREITDASGIVQKRYDYTAYGSLSLLTGSAPGSGLLTTGFTGHIHFQWQGMELVIAPYRIYDPRLGRWLSRDPIAEAGGINLYQYVGGNPINSWDPLGLLAIIIDGFQRTDHNGNAVTVSGMSSDPDKRYYRPQNTADLTRYLNSIASQLKAGDTIEYHGHGGPGQIYAPGSGTATDDILFQVGEPRRPLKLPSGLKVVVFSCYLANGSRINYGDNHNYTWEDDIGPELSNYFGGTEVIGFDGYVREVYQTYDKGGVEFYKSWTTTIPHKNSKRMRYVTEKQ